MIVVGGEVGTMMGITMNTWIKLVVLSLLLTGCTKSILPDHNTSIFVGYYNNEVTNIHQDTNFIEGIHNGQHVHGIVTQEGEWKELGRREVKGGIDFAEAGQLADVGSTAIGLAEGFTEANPLGIAILPTKYFLNEYAEESPECRQLKPIISGAGWGFAGANLAILSAGFAGPVSLGVGVLAGVAAYHFLPGDDGCIGWLGTKVK